MVGRIFCLQVAHLDRNGIRLKDYTHTNDGNVVMDSNLIRRFLEVLERKLDNLQQKQYRLQECIEELRSLLAHERCKNEPTNS